MTETIPLSEESYLAMGRAIADMWSGFDKMLEGYNTNITTYIMADARWHSMMDKELDDDIQVEQLVKPVGVLGRRNVDTFSFKLQRLAFRPIADGLGGSLLRRIRGVIESW